ncbi:leucine-rich repeat-containing protein 34 [Condylostylus longicornis]|uniref:leucine-rich repeat-containing protein 34 n=1 Tax=Condylostylus longicornis TaxID=2530218 RepID=UPI00244DC2F6|nr:leucine-rich repeat-containing protein 34 [Condylostylus longicornis]
MMLPYNPCQCEEHKKSNKILTPLILQCWQRDNFRRPYNHLYLSRRFFEEKLKRKFNLDDYRKIINYFFEILFNNEPKNITIKILRLNGTPITQTVAHLLRNYLIHNEFIEFLDIGNCNLNENNFYIIADGVYNSKSLKAFNMNRLILNNVCDTIDTERIALIISQLIWKNQLIELHLRNLQLNSYDIKSIAEYIEKQNSILLYLDLGSNSLTQDGIEILFKAIVLSNTLIGLDISHNSIGRNGGEIIAFSLPSTKIKYLNISYNGIDAIGMHLLLSVVKKTIPLKILNIFGNEFNSSTVYTLKRQIEAKTLIAENLDVDVVFDRDKNEFYLTPKIVVPEIIGKYLNKYNQLKHNI